MAKDLTAERLRELLSYDPLTGEFVRLAGRNGVGRQAGSVGGPGYVYISVDDKKYLAHRLAWLHTHGRWPDGQIDHINTVRTDNRLCNLREASPALNNENRRKVRRDNLSSGKTGVSRQRDEWRARIWVRGKPMFLGQFPSIEEASSAYLTAKRSLHQGCTI